jgi:hypothetical protein
MAAKIESKASAKGYGGCLQKEGQKSRQVNQSVRHSNYGKSKAVFKRYSNASELCSQCHKCVKSQKEKKEKNKEVRKNDKSKDRQNEAEKAKYKIEAAKAGEVITWVTI